MTPDEEFESTMFHLESVDAGLAVRYAGVIWWLPLCHDSYGEGNA